MGRDLAGHPPGDRGARGEEAEAGYRFVAGLAGYALARAGAIHLAPWLAARFPEEKHARFLADGFAHPASYAIGFLGGMVVIARTWRSRRQIPAG